MQTRLQQLAVVADTRTQFNPVTLEGGASWSGVMALKPSAGEAVAEEVAEEAEAVAA